MTNRTEATATRQVFIPPLPEGFTLDEPLPEGHVLLPPLPPGFTLDKVPPGFVPESSLIPEGFVPEKSTAEDVARSAVSGLATGAAGIPGAAGDAQSALKKAGLDEWLTNKVHEWFPNYMRWTKEYAEKHQGYSLARPEVGEIGLPTTEDIKKGTGLDATDYEPQTTGGKYAKSVGEFLPGAVTGGAGSARAALVNAARFGVAPGLASEAAGEALKGTDYEGAGRVIAGLAAPGLASRAISPFPFRGPEASAEAHARAVQTLRDEGVYVSAGRASDNTRLKYLENDLNPEAAKEELEGFTRAATRAAGAETPVLIHGQGGTVDALRREVGQRFDDLSSRNALVAHPQMGLELMDLRNQYTRTPGLYDEATVNALHGAADELRDALAASPSQAHFLTGEQYQRFRSRLHEAARTTDNAQKAQALHDFVNVLDNGMERSIAYFNPSDAGAWNAARGDYKKALTLEKAATAAGESSARGYVTPAQLERAAKAIYGARAYEEGRTPFSRLGNAGAAVLKALPDSGTSQRVRIDHAISALTGAATGALGFHLGGGAHVADSAIGGLILGERLGHFADAPLRAGLRSVLLNAPVQRYLGNQVAAGLEPSHQSLPGLLTAAEAARQ